ncbi:MAG TPA: signal peptidase I [Candidatus Nanoarchaeia archaeon]|nr:signal peptidase I [Candidatus Nanoarchaeia archaeon]
MKKSKKKRGTVSNKKKQKKFKDFLDKFWFIVWKDDSFRGWIISILFIFLVIKFVFFPLVSFVAGTSLPLAIVESCSMHHDGNMFSDFDKWWVNNGDKYERFNINKLEFEDFKLKRGFTKGDILFITGADPEKLEKGDIIVFNAGRNRPVIHRIVNIENTSKGYYFSTLGDNNPVQLSSEKRISEDEIIGKASFRIAPYLGWVKLVFYEPLRTDSEKGVC